MRLRHKETSSLFGISEDDGEKNPNRGFQFNNINSIEYNQYITQVISRQQKANSSAIKKKVQLLRGKYKGTRANEGVSCGKEAREGIVSFDISQLLIK